LASELQVAETEKRLATEQVARMEDEVKAERAERAKLADGVQTLATKTEDLATRTGELVARAEPLAQETVVTAQEPAGTGSGPAVTVGVPETYVWDGVEFVGEVNGGFMCLNPAGVWVAADADVLGRFDAWANAHPDWHRVAIRKERYRRAEKHAE
jgi:X-X-X-Leu-X-X-Gly heptad repeat protein